MLSGQGVQNVSTGLAKLGKTRTPGTRGRGSPLRGQSLEVKQMRKQNNQGLTITLVCELMSDG